MSIATYIRYELLRTFRNRRFFIFSLGFPLVLYFLIAGAEPARARPRRQRDLRAALLHGRAGRVRDDERGDRGRRADRRRAQRRLDPPAAADAALARAATSRTKVADRLPDGAGHASCCSTRPGSALGVRLPARAVGRDDGAAAGRAAAVRGARDPARPPARRSTRSGPAIGGTTALLAFLGGVWFPIGDGFMHDIARPCRPTGSSQASHVAHRRRRLGRDRLARGRGLDRGAGRRSPRWAYRRDTASVRLAASTIGHDPR